MSKWSEVGKWLQDNAGGLLGLAGAVATGNIPAGVAAIASMASEATGESDPAAVLRKLQTDPATMVRLEEIARANEADIRKHHREMLQMRLADKQDEHEQTQTTIRAGDAAEDPYVRHTRPMMARQSWYGSMAYIIGFEGGKAVGLLSEGASVELGLMLMAPALTYLGWRSLDKFGFTRSLTRVVGRGK